MKKQFLSALAAAALLAAVAPAALAQNVATVNGKSVPKSRVDALAQQVIRSGRQVTPEMQGQLKDEVIAREIFSQEAKARQLDTTEDYKTQLDLAAQSILIGANAGKEFKSRHILVEKEDQAKDIIAKLKKGAKFEDLAKKFSKDPGSGAKGGDLDWANPSNFVKEFTEALIALGKGKFTETPVKSQFGYHIIRLDDTREAQLPKFDDVKPQIMQQLQQQKMSKFQETLRAKAKIE